MFIRAVQHNSELDAFRAEVREFCKSEMPAEVRAQAGARPASGAPRVRRLAEAAGRARLADGKMAQGAWRARLAARAVPRLPGGARPRRRAAAGVVRPDHGRAGDLHLRHARAEEEVSGRHHQERDLVVPGLLGARRRLGPRRPQDARGSRRRPLRRQRPEDLDVDGALGRHDLRPRAHQSGRQEAGGHLVPADRHEVAGHHGAADHRHHARAPSQRGVLRERAGAGREPDRRGEQGLDLRQVPARQRARRQRRHRQARGLSRPDPASAR